MEPKSVNVSTFRGAPGHSLGIASAEDRAVLVQQGNIRRGAVVPRSAAEVLEACYAVERPSFANRARVVHSCSKIKAQYGELAKSLDEMEICYISYNGEEILGAWISNKALRDLVGCRRKWAERSGLTP